jgi:hypothetical protein
MDGIKRSVVAWRDVRHRTLLAALLLIGVPAAATPQNTGRIAGRVSVHTDTARREVEGAAPQNETMVTTAATFETTEREDDANGLEVGLDVRQSRWLTGAHPDRLSLYTGFVGTRVGGETGVRVRAGHMWLPDLGTIGNVAGGLVEIAQRPSSTTTRFRVGGFMGLEPKSLDVGYTPDVRKAGVYAAVQRGYLQRHVVGYTRVQQGSMTERSVLSTTNILPMGRAVNVYQAAEYEVRGPAQGAAPGGLSYFLANVRVSPSSRLELLGTYNRGRAIDARQLTADLLTARPLTQQAVEGLTYESGGGRVTVQPVRSVHVYASYARDRTNRDDVPAARVTFGGQAGDIMKTGVDAAFSDARIERSTGPYHSRYVSVGRGIGRTAYASVDYSTSLSVIRFERLDGVTIETRPLTRRWSGSTSINIGRTVSLLFTVDRTTDDTVRDVRILTGLSYRIR